MGIAMVILFITPLVRFPRPFQEDIMNNLKLIDHLKLMFRVRDTALDEILALSASLMTFITLDGNGRIAENSKMAVNIGLFSVAMAIRS